MDDLGVPSIANGTATGRGMIARIAVVAAWLKYQASQLPLSELQCFTLFLALEGRGWQWRGDFIYAPHGSMWLSRFEAWVGEVQEFHERMCSRLARCEAAHWMYQSTETHQALVADTRSLVEVLSGMLSEGTA